MPRQKLTIREESAIEKAILHYRDYYPLFQKYTENLSEALRGDAELGDYVQFIRARVKSEDRLRQKLVRKFLEQPNGTTPVITHHNLFSKINDLGGVRLIHLHTEQIADINAAIRRVLADNKYAIIEGPCANCWDVEYEALYKTFGIVPVSRNSMYSSVHYVVEMNTRTKITLELQVRTLFEEAWGEVSHRVGYEDEVVEPEIEGLLKVLARMTSGSTRLVDCIFRMQ